MRKIAFGTDGIRGKANEKALTPENITIIGMATGSYFHNPAKKRQLAVIGKDTRLSGYLIEPALTAGLISVGIDVLLVGPMPTPAVSMLTKSLRADFGIMISASHNPYQDNGIKIFGPDGYKLPSNAERSIEELMASYPENIHFAKAEKIGRARRLDDAPGRYIEFAKNTFPKGMRLSGLKIVVDAANGAAYHLASKIFWELGAEVISIGDHPDGININQNCGSMYPQAAIEQVIAHKADLGIVLDGDADRITIIDEKGKILDGDELLAAIAIHLRDKKMLINNTLVCTTMSNMGFEKFCTQNGIEIIRTQVGDRYVSEELKKDNLSLGGEQSGHIIISEHSSTGDGVISALTMLAIFVESGKKRFSQVCHPFKKTPQIIHNVKTTKPVQKIMGSTQLENALANAREIMGNSGRLNVRPSGTEPIIRIMAEHENKQVISKVLTLMESTIKQLMT